MNDMNHTVPKDPGSPSQMMIGVYNHLLSKVFRFHETILRFGDWIPRGCCFLVIVVVHGGDTLQGMDTYPTKREVRKIIDSNMPFLGGYVSFMVIHDVKSVMQPLFFLGGGGCFSISSMVYSH